METKEILNEGTWDKILFWLDKVFGFEDRKTSKIRKIKQTYDNKTNEHVIYFEYRVRTNGKGRVKRPGDSIKSKDQKLLYDINRLAKRLVD